MVAGMDLALAIRSLREQTRENILVQAKGIHFVTACDAVAEAGLALNSLLDRSSLLDGQGDLAPGGTSGRLSVLGDQYAVTYGVASGVLVALVTRPSASVFVCLDIVDAAVRLLASTTRTAHISAAKVASRFPELYSLLDELLSTGVDRLPPGFRHAAPDEKFRLSVPVSRADARRQLRHLLRGMRSGASTTQSSHGDPAASSHGDESGRAEESTEAPSLAAHVSPLHGIGFAIPPGALPPPPARALRRAPTARRPATQHSKAPKPEAAPPAFEGAIPEPVIEQEPVSLVAKKEEEGVEDLWATFAEQDRPVTGDLNTESEEKRKEETVEATPPAITDLDVRLSLQLVEVWHGRAAGGQLVEAGVDAAVRRRLAPYGLDSTGFRLDASNVGDVTSACLRQVGVSSAYTEAEPFNTGDEASKPSGEAQHADSSRLAPSWTAVFVRAPVDVRYLQYRLPAVAVPPPLEADLRLLPGSNGTALCVLRWVASPTLPPPGLFDLVADLALPHGVTLRAASHAVSWRPDTCQARLVVPSLAQGEEGTLCLSLDVVELQGATATATLTFTGPVGATLSGTKLEVGLDRGKTLRGQALFFGQLEVSA